MEQFPSLLPVLRHLLNEEHRRIVAPRCAVSHRETCTPACPNRGSDCAENRGAGDARRPNKARVIRKMRLQAKNWLQLAMATWPPQATIAQAMYLRQEEEAVVRAALRPAVRELL